MADPDMYSVKIKRYQVGTVAFTHVTSYNSYNFLY